MIHMQVLFHLTYKQFTLDIHCCAIVASCCPRLLSMHYFSWISSNNFTMSQSIFHQLWTFEVQHQWSMHMYALNQVRTRDTNDHQCIGVGLNHSDISELSNSSQINTCAQKIHVHKCQWSLHCKLAIKLGIAGVILASDTIMQAEHLKIIRMT